MQILPSQGLSSGQVFGSDSNRLEQLSQSVGKGSVVIPVETTKAISSLEGSAKLALAAEYEKPVDDEERKRVLESLNKTMGLMRSDLVFTVDDETKLKLVKIVDRETKEVIRQIPSEEIVRFVKVFDELRGVLLSERA
ncbi:flagellar protein FlaG [Laribacter hongkongensis]|uniref:flagellar protein FlaG n=1 Tax=Laribacter hongkongensis TaxID=168471 RepID=UPI001EFD0CFE|nr:flagellar protein FlaG [Laribacter hongkongensis]MCG9084217.1 flagellar protein FlaG [Laribacter hongkongensis]